MLELDWPKLHVRDGVTPTDDYVHGELFGVGGVQIIPDNPRGPRSKSIEKRALGRENWNVYDLVAVDGVAKLSVNGKYVNGIRNSSRRKGYLCMEAEGAAIQWRNAFIMELPPGVTTPDMIAPERTAAMTRRTVARRSRWPLAGTRGVAARRAAGRRLPRIAGPPEIAKFEPRRRGRAVRAGRHRVRRQFQHPPVGSGVGVPGPAGAQSRLRRHADPRFGAPCREARDPRTSRRRSSSTPATTICRPDARRNRSRPTSRRSSARCTPRCRPRASRSSASSRASRGGPSSTRCGKPTASCAISATATIGSGSSTSTPPCSAGTASRARTVRQGRPAHVAEGLRRSGTCSCARSSI